MPITRKNPRDPDSPFLTRDALRAARPFKERFPNADLSNVTVVRVPKDTASSSGPTQRKTVSIPISSDLVAELRATGTEWPALADKILRAGLKKLKQKAA